MDEKNIERICRLFLIKGEYLRFEHITYGHINSTYRVFFFRDGEEKDYILQNVNTYVFKDPIKMMDNITSVTEYIRAKIKRTGVSAKRGVLHYQKNAQGKYYVIEEDGKFWRCCRYIDNSYTFCSTDNLKVIEEAGKAFGEFQLHLSDYPVESLSISIPHFHNTIFRYNNLRTAVWADKVKRVVYVQKEIDDYLALESIATEMYEMQRSRRLPLRVTHNDTKCSNVLFDADTYEHLSVIDLDTVMPGLVGFDFGDAIRAAANKADEDEKDLSKVGLDLDRFEAFTKGFMGKVSANLIDNERNTMALGAITMTIECGIRFLTDYLEGDNYFSVDYPEHNLVRSRCQLTLAKDMLKHKDDMDTIVKKYFR